MTAAITALCDWARGPLGLQQLRVRVMADNPAVRFYEQLGFRPLKDVGLVRRQVGPAEFHWAERSEGTPSGERALRYMELAA
jgi:RimJ/RimL family protein N-acetyltransferase